MNIPRAYRQQIVEYEKAGFHPVEIEYGKGSHIKVRFAEFPEFYVLNKGAGEPRSIKNNIARMRALATKAKEKANETTAA